MLFNIEDYTPNRYIISPNYIDDKSIIQDFECPYCPSKDLEIKDTIMTLLGTIGGKDPNHYYRQVYCVHCGAIFGLDHHLDWKHKGTNIWYYTGYRFESGDRVCIKGIPNCCELGYKLPCNCGGLLSRTYRHNGKNTTICTYNMPNKGDRTPEFLYCDTCNLDVEIK